VEIKQLLGPAFVLTSIFIVGINTQRQTLAPPFLFTDKCLPVAKFEEHYGIVTKKGKLKYPFQGAKDSWTLHDWLSREEGLCLYQKNWKELRMPKDDRQWSERLKNDPFYFVVLEKVKLEKERVEETEKRDTLLKQRSAQQKKVSLPSHCILDVSLRIHIVEMQNFKKMSSQLLLVGSPFVYAFHTPTIISNTGARGGTTGFTRKKSIQPPTW